MQRICLKALCQSVEKVPLILCNILQLNWLLQAIFLLFFLLIND